MPKVYTNYEAFELIEKLGSITAEELAKHIGVKKGTAANWLSRWAKKDYLEWRPGIKAARTHRRGVGRPGGSAGRYGIGKKWGGELAFGTNSDQG